MTRNRFPARIALIAAAASIGLALSGCSAIEGLLPKEQAQRDDETQEIVEGGQADVFTIAVGDCLNEVTDAEVSEVPTVPCSEPHDEEVYFDFQLEGDEWPGDEAILTESQTRCAAEFETFVGFPYADSTLDFYPYTPTEAGWNEINDRTVSCVIYEVSGEQITGSLAGAAR